MTIWHLDVSCDLYRWPLEGKAFTDLTWTQETKDWRHTELKENFNFITHRTSTKETILIKTKQTSLHIFSTALNIYNTFNPQTDATKIFFLVPHLFLHQLTASDWLEWADDVMSRPLIERWVYVLSSAPPVCDNRPVCLELYCKSENGWWRFIKTVDMHLWPMFITWNRKKHQQEVMTHTAVGLSLVQSLKQLINGSVWQPDRGGRRRQRPLQHTHTHFFDVAFN